MAGDEVSGSEAALLDRSWRAAAECGPAAIALRAVTGASPEVIWVNRALTELLGVDPSELVGSPLSALSGVGGDLGADYAWATVAQSLLRGKGGQREGAVRRLDGSDVRVQLDAVPLAAGWLLNLHPLTDSGRDAEAALRESEHRFTALAESAPIGILLSDAGLRLGYVNDRFVQLTGREQGCLLGTGWLDVVLPEDLPLVQAATETALAGAPVEVTVRLVGRADTQRWMHLRLAPSMTSSRAPGFIGTAEDVTPRRAREELITYQAEHDTLTGLVNRPRLVELLLELLASKRLTDRQFAVLLVDLDGFRQINDRHGHEIGDRVLVEVARRLSREARAADVVARIAADEFVVVLRHVSSVADAEAVARRQLRRLAAPFSVAEHGIVLSASIGIAAPNDSDTPETILRAADQVMYTAKAMGTGHYRTAPLDRRMPTDLPGSSGEPA